MQMETPDEIRVDIISVLEARFGRMNSAIYDRIASINDIETLRSLHERAVSTGSCEEFFSFLPVDC